MEKPRIRWRKSYENQTFGNYPATWCAFFREELVLIFPLDLPEPLADRIMPTG